MGTEYDRRKDKYDQVLFRVQKGKAAEYRQAAQDFGLGFWELIQKGIESYIENHGGEVIRLPAAQSPDLPSKEDRALLDAFAKCPEFIKPTVRKLINQLAGIEQ